MWRVISGLHVTYSIKVLRINHTSNTIISKTSIKTHNSKPIFLGKQKHDLEKVEIVDRHHSKMAELHEEARQKYDKLTSEYRLLQASFKNYRSTLQEELNAQWKIKVSIAVICWPIKGSNLLGQLYWVACSLGWGDIPKKTGVIVVIKLPQHTIPSPYICLGGFSIFATLKYLYSVYAVFIPAINADYDVLILPYRSIRLST